MSTLDLILVAFLFFTFFSGLRKGLIRSLGRIFGLIIGAYIASNFYLLFYSWGSSYVQIGEGVGKVLSFVIIFIVATQITHLVFYLIEKIFNLLAIIPGSKYINNILGGALGLLEGALFLGMIFYIASKYGVLLGSLGEMVDKSIIVPWLNMVVDIILPILPDAIKAVQSII